MNQTGKENRTIETVLDLEAGTYIEASEFFKNPKEDESKLFEIRRQLEEAYQGIRKPLYVCWYCKQLVKISGGEQQKKILHFKHLQDSDDCPVKAHKYLSEDQIRRIKFNGCQESERHSTLKHFIADIFRKNQDVSNVEIEPVRKLSINDESREWRRPDVSINYKGKKLVFELQLSTTFLSVIVGREHFYKRDKSFIVWIFDQFEKEKDLQKFTFKDIHYSCKRNAFILNEDARQKSLQNNDLTLLCCYEKPKIDDGKITYSWEEEYVTLADLNFDEVHYKVYFYDTEKETERLNKYLEEEQEKVRRQKEEQCEIRIKRIRELLRDFFKTDILPNELQQSIDKLNKEEYEHFRGFLFEMLYKDYRTTSLPLIVSIYGDGKHKNLRNFLQQYVHKDSLEDVFQKIIKARLDEHVLSKEVEKIARAIFSLKINEVLGNKLNMIAFANNFLQLTPEFGQLFITACKAYGRFGELNRKDSFRRKVNDLEVEHNHNHDEIFKKIFPELF